MHIILPDPAGNFKTIHVVASGENQISLTDPDARAMTSTSHSAYTVGYNVQSAVDTKHHLIVTHEVTNAGIDKDQLSSISKQARDALNAETIVYLPTRAILTVRKSPPAMQPASTSMFQSLQHRTHARTGG